MGRIDLHTHTFASDGALLPAELVRRAEAMDHTTIAITDHAGPSNLLDIVHKAVEAAERLENHQSVQVIPGVELTHVPPSLIADLGAEAKSAGAMIVLVHGETIVEPVAAGTNLAAIEADDVDLLAHPGLLDRAEAKLAAETGTVLELTSRRGHSLTNGHVCRVAEEAGATLVVNTDTHAPGDLLTQAEAREVALGAGLSSADLDTVLEENPRRLLEELP